MGGPPVAPGGPFAPGLAYPERKLSAMARLVRPRPFASLLNSFGVLSTLAVLAGAMLATGDGAGDEGTSGESGTADEGKDNKGTEKPEGKPEGLTMSQADLDALVERRLGKAKRKWDDEAKTYADRVKMDEAERAKAERADAEKVSAEKVKGANTRMIKAEAKSAALAAGVKADRLSRFLRNVDLDNVDVDDDGNLDEKAVADAVKAALADVPEFAATGNGNGAGKGASAEFNGNGNTRKFTKDDIAKMSVDEFEKNEKEIMAQMRAGAVK